MLIKMENTPKPQVTRGQGNSTYLTNVTQPPSGQGNSFPTFHGIGTIASFESRHENKEPSKYMSHPYYSYQAQYPYQTQFPYQTQYPSQGQFPFQTQYPFYPFQNQCRFQSASQPTTEYNPQENHTSPLQDISTNSVDEAKENLIDVVNDKSPRQTNEASTSGSPCQTNINSDSPLTVSPDTRSVASLDNTSGYQSSNGSNCGSPYITHPKDRSVRSSIDNVSGYKPFSDSGSLYQMSTSSGGTGGSTYQNTSLSSQSPLILIPLSSTSPTPTPTPDSSAPVKKKKSRTNYTVDQLKTMEAVFNENAYPDCDKMEELSLQLGVAEQKIKVWFQNRRARWRKKNAASPVYNPSMSMDHCSTPLYHGTPTAPIPMYPAFLTPRTPSHVTSATERKTIHHHPFPMVQQSPALMSSLPVLPYYRQPAPPSSYSSTCM